MEKYYLRFEELLCAEPGPGVDGQFHLGDLLVDFLHKLDDEVDELGPVHLLSVEVCNQETYVVTLKVKEKFTNHYSLV